MAQVGAGLHNGVDLFDCVLWLCLSGNGVDLRGFVLVVDGQTCSIW